MRSLFVALATVGCLQPSSAARPEPQAEPPVALLDQEPDPSSTEPHVCRDATTLIPQVAERTVHSVVNVFTTRRAPAMVSPFFFGRPQVPSTPRQQSSLGSGVVVDASGLIVTNHHVVEDAEAIKVALDDGRELEAELVGSDPRSDLAVLKLVDPPDDLVPLAWGDSSALRLGETVLAVGNPFGMGHSVTRGIVSAKGRGQVGIVDYEDFIQTDAAINPGNSGGALVDLQGNLVGINTAIMSRSGGSQGIGLAIPAHLAERVVADLADDGRTDRGWLGVSIQQVTGELAEAMELPDTEGVLIGGVGEDTAAERAGLQPGDVVRQLDGQAIRGLSDFRNRIALAGAGHAFEMEVLRDGKARKLKGKLDRHPDQVEGGIAGERAAPEQLGLAWSPTDQGLEIEQVRPGSAAAKAGLRPGDVILGVGGRKATASRLEQALTSGRALLRVRNGEHERFVVLKMGGAR